MKVLPGVNSKYSTAVSLVVLVAVSSLFLSIFYPWFFTHPNEIISTLSGDGIKSYFVSMSYIKNQNFSNDFAGMNYPYGVTLIYTDGNPALSFIWKAVSMIIPQARGNFVGFYNVSILLSYLLSAILFFCILRSFYLPNFFSVAGAFTITMLSPQMFRVLGHPSFAFVAFFPLAWYLLIKFFRSERKILITILILVNSCFWFFVQPYYLMIITMFYFFSWVLYLLRAKNRQGIFGKIIFFLVHVVVPIIIVKLYLSLIDHHPPRPQYPGGFFEYNAKFETVFAPYYSPLTDLFKNIFGFNTDTQQWEGWAYIGVSAVIVFFFSIFRLVRYILKKRIKRIFKPVLPKELGTFLWAAVIVLLFSMCIPFKWNLEFLLEYMPWLRQFRALGRFAWVFYYVFSVYAVYILYQVFRKFTEKKLVTLAYTVVTLFFVFNLSEAAWYQAAVSESFKRNNNPFISKNAGEDFNKVVKRLENKEQYQCIVPLPYYHSGGEEFEANGSDKSIRLSMLFSYQTGIPLMSNASARTSIEEGRTLMNFFAPPFIERKIKGKLNSDKKFLVLYSGEELNPFEKAILGKSVLITKANDIEMYELSYDSVFNPKFDRGEWLRGQNICFISDDMRVLTEKGFTGEVCQDLISRGFDTAVRGNSFMGEGSFKGIMGDYSMVLEPDFYPLIPGKEYVVSYWYRYTGEKSNENTLVLEEKDSSDKITGWLFGHSAKESYLGMEDWIFVQRKFRLSEGKNKFDLFFKGKDEDKNSFTIDELMIRPADKNILSVKKGSNKQQIIFYNNIPFDTLHRISQ